MKILGITVDKVLENPRDSGCKTESQYPQTNQPQGLSMYEKQAQNSIIYRGEGDIRKCSLHVVLGQQN